MHQPCLVIMAAGMGSRFGGPKQTTPVDEYGHFLLHYSLFDAYRAGDAAAKRVIETYIGYLASGIASLINIFQPEVFIIGGGVSNEKQFLLDLLLPRIDAEDFAKNAKKRTRVVIATCGNDAGIIGAAMNE